MSQPWIQEIWRIVRLFILALLIGLLVEQVLALLLLASTGYLAWHLYNLYRLELWLRESKKFYPPEAAGIWGEVFYHFSRLQQRNRKRKRKLASMLKRFRRSTSAMPDGAVVLGAEQEIEWMNKAATQLLGLRSPQDKGQLITNLIRSPDFCRYLAEVELGDYHKKKGGYNPAASITLHSPINNQLILKITVVPYAGNRHLMLARDVTHIYQLEQIRSDFIANVSHELKTPLTVVHGFIETLLDDITYEQDEKLTEWQRPLELMSQQSTRMRSIVNDLLLLSRLESSEEQVICEPIHIAELLHTICDEAKLLGMDKNHTIKLDIDENLLLDAREEEIRSAFSNLIFNAVRYTPEEGNICVCWYANKTGIHLAVKDTGEGIAPEHVPRLTERFYRVDVARSRDQGGTGLGLAIVKHVLSRHQAQLYIESEVGKGSLFRCDFPKSMMARD